MRMINESPEFDAPLNEQEVKDFLSNSKLNLHFGILNERSELTSIQYGITMIQQMIEFTQRPSILKN